jgi:hypothetical protein
MMPNSNVNRNAKSLRAARVCQPFNIKTHPLDSTKTPKNWAIKPVAILALPPLNDVSENRFSRPSRKIGRRLDLFCTLNKFLVVQKRYSLGIKSRITDDGTKYLARSRGAPAGSLFGCT